MKTADRMRLAASGVARPIAPEPSARAEVNSDNGCLRRGRANPGAITLEVRAPQTGHGDVSVTVIVPLAEHEAEPVSLLATMPGTFEFILARGGSRASSMNRAASVARGQHLWFVHADTTLEADAIVRLLNKLGTEATALHYFDVRFDGGVLMRLTDLGVSFRSRILGLPFGDQAFCIPATSFRALGGYNEVATYGEDHLLVRSARRAGLPVRPVGATVVTSARKYQKRGWFRTTLTHLRLTVLLMLRSS